MLIKLFGKYRALVGAIALFLLLDAAVLATNFYTSLQMALDAKTVNLAGRQRMLSQRMVKSLFELQDALESEQPTQHYLEELKQAKHLFNQTLNVFEFGQVPQNSQAANAPHSAKTAPTDNVQLQALKPGPGRDALVAAKELWLPYMHMIDQLLAQQRPEQVKKALEQTLGLARKHNVEILNLMNTMTTHIERAASAKAAQLRMVQIVGIVLAVLNFILILWHFLGQLRASDKALEEARKETQNILCTVNEGLFLLDAHLCMGAQHSSKLEQMFGIEQGGMSVERCHFKDFLLDRVKPKELETALRFVSLLFRNNIKPSLIDDLNPLTRVEIHVPNADGGYHTRYMQFDFSRVMSEGEVKHVLVTVRDVTKEVLIGKQLDASKVENARQIEMLTGILHADAYVLRSFIQNAFDTFKRINELFRQQDKTSEGLGRKLRDILLEVHNFKSEAASLNLNSVADLAHKLESSVQQLLQQSSVTGTDLLAALVVLEELIGYTESINTLTARIARLSAAAPAEPNLRSISPKRWQHFHDLAQSLAVRHDKKIMLHLTGFNEAQLTPGQGRLISDMCIQFIRNAVVHGIELPQMRVLCKKPETGRLDLSLIQLADGGLELHVRDDGRGVDYDKIRNQAIFKGLAKAEELRNWDNKKIIGLMFKPGFTTAEEAGQDAGRGIGMDVIIARVQQLKGSIKIASRSGQACHFVVAIPGNATANSKAA